MSVVKGLHGEIQRVTNISDESIGEMYGLMTSHYEGVNRDIFQRDLLEKRDVIVLRDSEENQIKGFSTLMLLEEVVDESPVTALFSGDTIIDKEYWGTNELPKWWGKYAFNLIDEMPGKELYWFLMSKGYKTYRFLPVFFNEFPEREKRVLDSLAFSKFPDNYDSDTGVICFEGKKDHLKQGVADIDNSRMNNPDIKYFVERNPGWQQGDELVCIVKLTKDNFNKMGHRVVTG
jgi:hypothetical protein